MSSKSPKENFMDLMRRANEGQRLKIKGDYMNLTMPGTPGKLVRKILWRGMAGVTGVVQGPFPSKFVRSETRPTVHGAAKQAVHDLHARPETTLDTQYALVWLRDVTEEPDENDFGPVMP